MMLKLITPPPFEPLTLAEAKEYFRVDHNDEDATIAGCVSAAVQWADGLDGFLGRALIDQTWELTLDAFPTSVDSFPTGNSTTGEIRIPLPPLIEIVSVYYDDPGGIPQTLDPSKYSVDKVSQPGWIVPVGSWPTTFAGINAVRIRFRAGYVDASSSPNVGAVPESIKQALKLYAVHTYDVRSLSVAGRETSIPWSAEQLLRRHRVEIPLA